MCEPTTAMLIISAVSAGASYISGNQIAEAQAAAANNATALAYQQNTERQQQVNEQSALDKSERIKQGMVERGKMATIAGESGALGISSDRLLNDSFMQEGTDMASLEKNRLNQGKQTGWANANAQASGQSAINQAEANAPSLLQTGLQIGSAYYTSKALAEAKAEAKVG